MHMCVLSSNVACIRLILYRSKLTRVMVPDLDTGKLYIFLALAAQPSTNLAAQPAPASVAQPAPAPADLPGPSGPACPCRSSPANPCPALIAPDSSPWVYTAEPWWDTHESAAGHQASAWVYAAEPWWGTWDSAASR